MTRKSRPFWNRLTQAMTAQAVKTDAPQRLQPASAVRPLALEQRFMFDGAAAVDVAHAATDAAAAGGAEHAVDTASALRHALTAEAQRAAEGSPGAPQRQEVVFVDNRVQDYQQLISGLKPGTEVVVLDSSKDGLQQIADYLDGRSGIDVVHVLSHGDTGKVQLGNLWLDSQNLASHSQALASLGKALNADGDILLYGCEIGADGAGRDFIESLAKSTGADVAASTNLTGAHRRGGDWVLETSTGSIEAALPFALADVRDYDGVLGAPVSGTTDFGSGGNDTTLASGPGNLGVTAQNARGSGWDVTVTTTTATNISIAAGDLYFNTGDGIYYADSNFDGEPLQSFKVASNSGSIFDLKSVDVTIASQSSSDKGQTTLLVTGYRNGVAVSGASQSFNIAIFGGQSNLETLDLSVNSNFVGVDSFVITRSSGLGVIYLGIDNINAASVRAPTLAPSMSATGVNPIFTENGTAVTLFSGVNADTHDSGQSFTGAQFTVSNVAGTSEYLTIHGVNVALSNGNSVSLGSGYGTASISVSGGLATINLSGATLSNADMSSLLSGMTYGNSSDNPGSAARTVTLTQLTDSGTSNNTVAPNISSVVAVVPVNDAPTEITLSSTAFGQSAGNNATVATLSATDVDSSAFTYSLVSGTGSTDNVSFALVGSTLRANNPSGMPAGLYSIRLRVTDDGGASYEKIVTLTVADDIAPTFDQAPAISNATSGGFTISGSVTEASTFYYVVVPDGASAPTATQVINGQNASGSFANASGYQILNSSPYDFSLALSGLAASTMYDVYVVAKDSAGNSTSSVFKLDVTTAVANNAPTTTVDSVQFSSDSGASAFDLVTNISAQTISGMLSAALATGETVQVSLDNGASWTNATIAVGQTNWSLSGQTLTGSNTLQARVTNSGGSSSSYTHTYTVDTTAPATPAAPALAAASDTGSSSSDNITNVTTPVLTGTAEVGSTVTLYDTDGVTVLGISTANGSGNWSITSISLSDGLHSLSAIATDTAGNRSTASNKLNVTIDTSAPTGMVLSTNFVARSMASAGATVATLSASDSSSLTYQLAVGNGVNDADNAAFTLVGNTLKVSVAALSAGTYHIYLKAADTAGNATYLATTVTVQDSPTVSSIVRAAGASASVSGTATQIEYTVTFSEAVTGVDSSDFALTDTGTAFGSIASVSGSGTTYTVTVSGISGDGSLRLDLKSSGTGIQGTSGNITIAGGYTSGESFTLDHTAPATPAAPTLAAVSDNGVSSSDGITNVTTPTFTGTAESGSTVTVYEGSTFLGSAVATGGVWSVTSTTLSEGSHTITATATDAAGNVSAVSSGVAITIDTMAPTVAITSSATALKAGESATFTFTFSEVPSEFTLGDLIAMNGTLSNFTATSNPLVYTAVFTPIAGLTGSSGAVSLVAGTYTDTAGNAGVGGISSPIAIDTAAPSVLISSSASSLKAGETAVITFTFSDAPQGFDLNDVTVAGGTLSSFAVTANPLVYTAIFTPTADVDVGQAAVSISAGSYTDAAGNMGPGASSATIHYDTGVPTTTVESVQFSDDTGASASDLITNISAQTISGTLSTNLASGESVQVSLDSGATWATATVVGSDWTLSGQTLSGSGVLQVRVADSTGNAGPVYSAAYILDQSAPTVAISSDVATVNGMTPALITFTFSEAPVGFSAAAISVAGGTLGALTATSDPKVFIATFTPNSGIASGSAFILVRGSEYTDTAGNAGAAGMLSSLQIDTVAPAATPGGIQFSNDSGVRGDFITNVGTQTISGNLSAPLAQGDRVLISLDGGASWITASASGTNWSASATLHPGSNTLQVKVSDSAGNEGAILSQAYVYDTTAPSVVHVDLPVDGAYGVGQRLDFTVHFSEAVIVDASGGTPRIEVTLDTGGIAHAEYLSGSGTSALVFRLVVASGQQDNNGITVGDSIQLNGGSLRDLAGNDGAIALTPGSSSGVLVDGVVPTVADVIVPANGGYKAGDVLSFTVNASEAVFTSGLPRLAVDIGGTTRYANFVASSSGGSTLVFQYTVQAGDNDANGISVSASLDLNGGSVHDAAGNNLVLTLNGLGATSGVIVDTLRPTATIVVADTSLAVGETSLVTITFSEAVNDFTNADLSVSGGTLSTVSSSDGGVTWTATFTPTANITATSNLITLNNAGVTDKAGNAGVGSTDSNNYAIDTLRPTATIAVADTALAVGETSTVTITFSEAVDGFDNSDLSVSGGTLSAVSSSDGGVTWTATFTPTANITATSNLITLNNAGVTDKTGNAGVGSTDSNNYAIDTLRPTATIVVADTSLAVGETSLVTITFSEAVNDFTNADLSVSGGTLSAVSSSDGGTTWTATFTPTANLESTVNRITLNNAGVADKAGNAGVGATDSNNYAIDTLRPTATIVVADTSLAVGETSLVTIIFSEAVNDFTNADLSVSGGTLSTVSSSDGGITWTATFTPTANLESTVNLITLNNAGVTDKAGNAGVGATDSNNYAIDTLRPTATIVVADTSLAVGETSLVTIIFSEAVNDFTNADLSVSGGTLSTVSSSDGGITWTATFTPTANLESTVNLITLNNAGVTDKAGNAGVGATDSNNYAIDTLRPTATIVVADTSLAVGETSLVTIIFSEAVNDFTNADLSVSGGTLSTVSSSDGGITWTATFTPTANLESTVNLITLNNAGVTDKAGNAGVGSTGSNAYAIDTLRPTATITVADPALAVGETSTVTITFSEAVDGFDNSDLSVSGGTLSAVTSIDGGITWTATFTPTANLESTVNLITLNNTGVTDKAGNAGVGTTDSNNYAVDTLRPTATIVVADAALAVGESSTVTITFSEAVTGLDIGDFTVANGVLSNLSSSDGGITWTAILTPTASVTDTTNVIALDDTGYVDAAGNTGSGTTDSNNYAIDTQRPTATIVVNDTALAVGESSTVAITFSEAVMGLDIGDFTVANGVLSNLSSSDGGITWTAILTPTAGITDTTNVITLDNTGYADAAGNTGSGTTDSNSYAIDTQRPTATIVVTDNALRVGETSLVTITFSETVTGLDLFDFSVEHGALSNLTSSDGGLTWTATLTPTAGITDTSNLIKLNNTGYEDAAGNTGTGTTDSSNYAIDTQRPTATIVVNDTALAVGESSTVIITFSEAVTGLDVGDFSVEHGALSNLTSSDGGITWTVTLTPTAGITDTSNVITLNNTGYVDAAGNSGIGTAISNSYAIDTLDPVAPEITLDQATLVNGRQVSPTGLVFISGLEAEGRWQYSLDNGVSWIEGRGNSLQLPGLGAFSLWVQQRDVAGNVSSVTSLSGVVEPLLPPAVQAPFAFAVSNSSDGLALAPFQPSEVPEPNADFLHPASMMLGSVSRDTGMPRQDSWSEYGLQQSIAGVNDWMWASLFAPAEPNRSGFDPAPEQFSVTTGASTLDLKPVLLASDSPWDIESLRFSFSARQELPAWVRLDRHTGQLTINAPKDLSTTLVLQIKVSDGKGHESVRTVKVVIGEARAASSAPAGRAGLSEKMANAANQQAGKRMSMYVHG
uniref:Ig-like domain-containing protein n=1 Tax=Comamonas testosteroni TaxID=285 RepID=UPI0015F7B639|nr:Ig-like domain-containing protein [Comamonas testosteroni]